MKLIYLKQGSKSDLDITDNSFGELHQSLIHLAVRSQLSGMRSGTSSTKTRAEVRGGGAKPWRQKGTGRARHGSRRSPIWRGGGVAQGPKPRSYELRTNRKERSLALKTALAGRASDGKLFVFDPPSFEQPETAKALDLLEEWGLSGKTLIVCTPAEEAPHINLWKSFRNLPLVLTVTNPTTYSVIAADNVLITKAGLDAVIS